jgi:peptidylprolyl isomerase
MRLKGTTTRGLPGVVIMALLIAMAAAGCGGGGSSDASAKNSGDAAIPSSPPNIEVPEGLPPKKLVIKDLHVGTGVEAKKGDRVMIQYYGVSWGTGAEHANSWRYTHVPIFKLGTRRILRGFNLTIPGMKEGGSREVIIPYNLVYYPGGHHVHLGVLDALIYRIYLVKILGNNQSQR